MTDTTPSVNFAAVIVTVPTNLSNAEDSSYFLIASAFSFITEPIVVIFCDKVSNTPLYLDISTVPTYFSTPFTLFSFLIAS